jgi:hypothetical protein
MIPISKPMIGDAEREAVLCVLDSILFTGATPVFVDVLPCCFNIDPDAIEDCA